jgi:heme A synthase
MVTIHKLFSLGVIVYLVMAILHISKMAPLSKVELITCIVTALLFLGAVITGSLLNAVKNLPALTQALHKVLSVLTFLSTAATFFFLFRRS